jgi:hypothetical protein
MGCCVRVLRVCACACVRVHVNVCVLLLVFMCHSSSMSGMLVVGFAPSTNERVSILCGMIGLGGRDLNKCQMPTFKKSRGKGCKSWVVVACVRWCVSVLGWSHFNAAT